MITPTEELAELEVTAAPGEIEAAAIRLDHETATKGMRAFVKMGFRLMDVKSRLPHGAYIAWCEKHLKGLSRPMLHRSKFIADGMGQMFQCETFEGLPFAALEIIDGASESGGIRALLAEVHEFAEPEGSELNAKQECEKRWTRKPEERDEWEPRVLSGEISYLRALQGMLGTAATVGKPRDATKVGTHLNRAANGLKLHFLHYDKITPDAKTSFLINLTEAMEKAPDEVKVAVLAVLKGGRA